MQEPTLTIAIPCLDEVRNFDTLCERLQSAIKSLRIPCSCIFVGPPDGEHNMRQKVEAAGFTYVQRQPTSGYGDAIRTAIVEANSSHIGFMDADNSHDPVFFVNAEPYLKNGADLVVGSRYMNGGSTANGLLLRFLSHVVNVVFRAILGTNISDLSNSQKVYKRALINRPLTCQNFDIIEELVWNVITYGNKTEVFEIPATFEKRLYGETKRKLIPFTVGYARTAVRFLFFKLHRHFGASCK